MADELRADPDDLIRLAAACLTAATTVGDPFRDRLPELVAPAYAFGDLPAATGAVVEAQALVENAGQAMLTHVQTLEGDADRLVQTAFTYRAADQLAAEGMGGSRRAGL
jgi:hypothetical protein